MHDTIWRDCVCQCDATVDALMATTVVFARERLGALCENYMRREERDKREGRITLDEVGTIWMS